jgi:DNA sulfur modification protein DndC
MASGVDQGLTKGGSSFVRISPIPLGHARENFAATAGSCSRKMTTGVVQLFHDRPIHGPYTQESRANWLRKLLRAQGWIGKNGPGDMRDLELITIHELNEIRRIWVVEKHEIEDLLPGIYESELGEPFPGSPMDNGPALSADDLKLLAETCGADRLRYELARDLLDVERRFRGMACRVGLFDAIEDTIRRCFYEGEQDATDRMLREKDARSAASEGRYEQLALSDWIRKE